MSDESSSSLEEEQFSTLPHCRARDRHQNSAFAEATLRQMFPTMGQALCHTKVLLRNDVGVESNDSSNVPVYDSEDRDIFCEQPMLEETANDELNEDPPLFDRSSLTRAQRKHLKRRRQKETVMRLLTKEGGGKVKALGLENIEVESATNSSFHPCDDTEVSLLTTVASPRGQEASVIGPSFPTLQDLPRSRRGFNQDDSVDISGLITNNQAGQPEWGKEADDTQIIKVSQAESGPAKTRTKSARRREAKKKYVVGNHQDSSNADLKGPGMKFFYDAREQAITYTEAKSS